MKRREALAALVALACAGLGTEAHPNGADRRIGFLYGRGKPAKPGADPYLEAFVGGLRELGFVEGKNLHIEWRYADGDYQRHTAQAADLAALKVEVIVTSSLPSTQAAMRATRAIPVVFAAMVDPVGTGTVKALARPEGNVTGFSLMSLDLVPKQLEMLREVQPKLKRVSLLINPAVAVHKTFLAKAQSVAQKLGIAILPVEASRPEEVERGFAAMAAWDTQAVIMPTDSFFNGNKKQIAQLALKHRIIAMLPHSADAEAGALLSYGPDLVANYRQAAGYVAKILMGAKPGDLPVVQPMFFQLGVNLGTAKTLGIKIPQSLLLSANEVIE